ncbi:MAG TPA: hypothetical protein VGR35_08055 [Tepidisphaeraceae bacterium]|nr:hypothetical protein [Tepidisphaeraceae bacterium]
MTKRQQTSREFVVGEYRTLGGGIIAIHAADESRELGFDSTYFKRFSSRQAASQWRDYRRQAMMDRDLADYAVIALPIPQDD